MNIVSSNDVIVTCILHSQTRSGHLATAVTSTTATVKPGKVYYTGMKILSSNRTVVLGVYSFVRPISCVCDGHYMSCDLPSAYCAVSAEEESTTFDAERICHD